MSKKIKERGKMYICDYCEAEFEEPEVFYERHGLSTPPYEKFYVCPFCGSGGYFEKEEKNDD